MDRYEHEGLTFDVSDDGAPDADVVILLHGFPEDRGSWRQVTPSLVDAGYRVLAPDQRGYSPGARPKGRRAYRIELLVGDVIALADAAGADRFHVVGHDWGGGVAWALAARHPERLRTLTSLATPHGAALRRSLRSSTQGLRSWYFLFFQLPYLPELAARSKRMRQNLVRSGLDERLAEEYATKLRAPGAASAALAWYRAAPFAGRAALAPVDVPVLYVYAGRDVALGRKAADLTGDFVAGPYRYEVLDDASHWLPEEHADEVVPLLLEHLSAHP